MLLSYKADINAKTNAKNTPLHLAAIFGHDGAGEKLIAAGVNLVLQCLAVSCSVLQCVAVCCSVLQCDALLLV